MAERTINVAEAKQRLSDLLGRVAFGGESFVIARRGKPMAMLVPVSAGESRHLGDVEGWLDEEDPFVGEVDRIVGARGSEDLRLPEGGGDE